MCQQLRSYMKQEFVPWCISAPTVWSAQWIPWSPWCDSDDGCCRCSGWVTRGCAARSVRFRPCAAALAVSTDSASSRKYPASSLLPARVQTAPGSSIVATKEFFFGASLGMTVARHLTSVVSSWRTPGYNKRGKAAGRHSLRQETSFLLRSTHTGEPWSAAAPGSWPGSGSSASTPRPRAGCNASLPSSSTAQTPHRWCSASWSPSHTGPWFAILARRSTCKWTWCARCSRSRTWGWCG